MTKLPELDDPIHLCSRFLLKRNIAKHPFPHKLTPQNRANLLALIPSAKPLEELSFELADIFQVQKNLEGGQGFIDEAPLLILINHDDHLSFYGISSALKWNDTKKLLLEKEKSFSFLFPFAYHPKFGFLTSHFDTCGAAFTYTIDLHLPLLHRLGHLESALQEELTPDVKLSSVPGDFISISNGLTLGCTEEHIFHSVNASAERLKKAELSLREHIGEHKEIKDLIARAFGLLQHSCQLEFPEALDALSLLMLGVELKFLEGMTFKELFDLTFLSKREFLHIPHEEDLLEKRASFFKEKLAHLKPLI